MTPKPPRSFDTVAVVLAAGIALALNVLVFAVVYDAIRSEGPGLSENATQILTGWGGGMIGVLGAYVGYSIGDRSKPKPEDEA